MKKAISFENGWYFANAEISYVSEDNSKMIFEFDAPDYRQFSDIERELCKDMGTNLERIELIDESGDGLSQSYFGYVNVVELTRIDSKTDGNYRIRLSLSQPDLHELVTRVYMRLTQMKGDINTVTADVGGSHAETSSDIMMLLSQIL